MVRRRGRFPRLDDRSVQAQKIGVGINGFHGDTPTAAPPRMPACPPTQSDCHRELKDSRVEKATDLVLIRLKGQLQSPPTFAPSFQGSMSTPSRSMSSEYRRLPKKYRRVAPLLSTYLD